jgi:serine/threonine protein kinase
LGDNPKRKIPVAALLLNGRFGQYELSQPKGPKGKFGGVWLGKRLGDGLLVTAKKLPQNPFPDEAKLQQVVLSLMHPNLAQSIEVVRHLEDDYLIRTFVEGTSLKIIAKKYSLHKHLAPSFYIEMAIHLLKGLEHLHLNGVVHRDVKPSNIIIKHPPKAHPNTWQPTDVVLIDFELACQFPVVSRTRSPFSMVYSAPEQLLNHNHLVGPWSDVFALTVMLYELMSGTAPWVDCNAEILMNLQLTYPLKKPRHVDDALFAIMAQAGYKEPFPLPPRRLAPQVVEQILLAGTQKRLSSAAEYRQQLEGYLAGSPKLERPNWFERFLWG